MTDADQLLLITESGQLIRIKVKDIRETGRAAQGVRVIQLEEGDRVVGRRQARRAGRRRGGGPGRAARCPHPPQAAARRKARGKKPGAPFLDEDDGRRGRGRRGLDGRQPGNCPNPRSSPVAMPAPACRIPPPCDFFSTAPASKRPAGSRISGFSTGSGSPSPAAEAAGVDYRKAIRELAVSDRRAGARRRSGADDPKGMYKEARELAKLGKDIVIRLPLRPEGMRVARLLAQDQIATCAAGLLLDGAGPDRGQGQRQLRRARRSGRSTTPGTIGMDLVEQVIRVYDNYGFQTQIVVSDARNPDPRARRRADGRRRGGAARGRARAALPASVLGRAAGREALVKVSADRILYLSRVVLKSLKENRNLEQKADDETAAPGRRPGADRQLRRARRDRGEGPRRAGQAQESLRDGPGVPVLAGRSRTSSESTAPEA